jgi:hypothetical protein
MNLIGKHAVVVAALAIATQAVAQQITLFGSEGFQGGSVTVDGAIANLERSGFAGRASSAVVSGDWELCSGPDYSGRCFLLLPGEYPSLADIGLSDGVSSARAGSRHAPTSDPRYQLLQSTPQIVFYEQAGFRGQSFGSERPILDLERLGFNDRASSLLVLGEAWEVCDGARFSGRCVVLRPGRYPSPGVIGLNGAIASVRPAR